IGTWRVRRVEGLDIGARRLTPAHTGKPEVCGDGVQGGSQIGGRRTGGREERRNGGRGREGRGTEGRGTEATPPSLPQPERFGAQARASRRRPVAVSRSRRRQQTAIEPPRFMHPAGSSTRSRWRCWGAHALMDTPSSAPVPPFLRSSLPPLLFLRSFAPPFLR